MVLIAVVLAPWLFGCAEPWAWLALGLVVQIGAAFRLFGIFREGYVNAITARAAGVCALLLAYSAFQFAPMPAALAAAMNPLGAEAQATAQRLLAQTEDQPQESRDPALETPRRLCISVSPSETRRAFHLLALCALAFLTLLSSISDREEVEAMTLILVANGMVLAAFAILQDLSDVRAIYGMYKPRLGGTFYGPFPNRNHFALHMNLAIGCAAALLLSSSRHALTPRFLSWGDRLALLSSRRVNVIVMLSYSALLMAAAAILSLSRGGMLSLLVSGAFMLAFYHRYRRHGGAGITAWIFSLAVAAVVAWIGWRPLLERLHAWNNAFDPLSDTRWRMTVATLRVWAAAPLTGWGFGAFQHAFPIFQERALQVGRFIYSHNDYAQLLAEGGLVGLAAWIFAAVVFLVGAARGYGKASEESRLFFIGLSFALCAAALHSFVDFGLRRPANAFLLAAVLAMALMVTRLPGYGRSYMYETGISGFRVYLAVLVCAAGLLGLFARTLRELSAELQFASSFQWRQIIESAPAMSVRTEAAEALRAEIQSLSQNRPADNPESYLDLGIAVLKTTAEKDLPADVRIDFARHAEDLTRTAVRQAPSDYEYWLWFSRALLVHGKPMLARFAAGRAQDLAPPDTAANP
jgi:O-antigen ligase